MSRADREMPGRISSLRALELGVLAGAVAGGLAALLSIPIRRWAGVGDRSLINGVDIVISAVIIWAIGGLLYRVLTRRVRNAIGCLLAATALAAVVGIVIFAGPLRDFSARLPSCAIPICLIELFGGFLAFVALLRLEAPLRLLTPAGALAALAVAIGVTIGDHRPAVHYTLTKVNAAAANQQQGPQSVAAAARPSPTPDVPRHFSVTNQSETSYTVNEKRASLPAPDDAVGKTNAITGDLYVSGAGLLASPPSSFTVDLTTLASDEPGRDRAIKGNTLDVAHFPTATYAITSVDGFPSPYVEGQPVFITLHGDFTAHGVTKPMIWTGQAQYAGGKLEAVMSATFNMTDFGINPPNSAATQAQNAVRLDLHLFAEQQP